MEFRYDTYCGLYCGACGVIHAIEKGELEEMAKKWDSTAEKMECHGCKSDHVAEFCTNCTLRNCAMEKGVEYCYECGDYSCDRMLDFLEKQAAHHKIHLNNLARIAEVGLDAWLLEQSRRWSCEACGTKFHFDEKTCIQCGREVYNLANEAEDLRKEN